MQALFWEDQYTSIGMNKGKSRQVDEPETCTCDSGYFATAHSSTSTSTSSSSIPGLSYSPSLSGSANTDHEGTFRAALFDDGEDDWNYTPSCCDASHFSRDRRKALPRLSTHLHPLATSSDSEGQGITSIEETVKYDKEVKRSWSDWWKGIAQRDRRKRSAKISESHSVEQRPEQEDIIYSMVQMQVIPTELQDALPEGLDSPPPLNDSWDDSCTDNCHLEEAPGYTQSPQIPYRILVNTDLYLMSALENVMMERRKIRSPLKQRGYVEKQWQSMKSSPLRQAVCVS